MKLTGFTFIWCVTLLFSSCKGSGEELPVLNKKLREAKVYVNGDFLMAETGMIKRTWEWTGKGFVTRSLEYKDGQKIWSSTGNGPESDWAYFGLLENAPGELVVLKADTSTDDGFTSEHLRIIAEIYYADVETFVKYEAWVYPGSPGIRTQVWFKGAADKHYQGPPAENVDRQVEIDRAKGKNQKPYAAQSKAALWYVNHAYDEKQVQYHLKGLDPGRKYKIALTWWDWDESGRIQDVQVASVDGETKTTLLSRCQLPESPEMKMFDLPSQVLLDGSFRLFIHNLSGKDAMLSEIMVFEKEGSAGQIKSISAERQQELASFIPAGYSLTGYADCGATASNEVFNATGRVDFVPLSYEGKTKTFIGYFNDTQHRNTLETPLLRKEISDKTAVNWASVVAIDDQTGNGLLMVKESHKCVNQYGVDTGDFLFEENGLSNTGTSLYPSDISPDEYKSAWASWVILYQGEEEERELELKQFDRYRYPVDPARDIYIQANTWGSGRDREAAREENVLKEIVIQAELGIDVQQIDDGWQSKPDWTPRADWYPQGWENVKAAAKEKDVKLGLWAAAMPVTLDALKRNYDQGGFISYKLDFANLGNHKNMEELTRKIRDFIQYTGHKVRVNWDVTENAPRFGYYWAREYGCVYLENRKPDKPANVVYIPHLVLRDIWHLAAYTNINKFQTTIQNIDRVNREISDAYLHYHPYAVAIGLIGTPLFFQETQFYSEKARTEIKPVLEVYKTFRKEWYESYIFPIGEEPDNKSWSGFQAFHPEKKKGYLIIFRELNNQEPEKEIALRFLKNTRLQLTNLMNGEVSVSGVDENGKIVIRIPESCDFRIFKYEEDNI